MLTISKPLSAGQAQSYHQTEFTAEQQNYWSQHGVTVGEWQGRLARQFGLVGSVSADDFAKLGQGQHPQTASSLCDNERRTSIRMLTARLSRRWSTEPAGMPAFSAPKSVSLTALVGGDDRVRDAHRESVRVAVDQLEHYTQARIGGNHPPVTSGKFIAAKFEQDTARPVDGYVAPQLHTHPVVFNVTERDNGQPRAVQPQSLFASQQFATAIYQSELTYRLRQLGYQITTGRSGTPEIKGYTQEYLDASSPRSQQIREYLERTGLSGKEVTEIAAHSTRDRKEIHSPGEVMAAHRKLAAEFGHQAEAVVRVARERSQQQGRPVNSFERVRESLTFSRDKNFEREAVVDERALIRDGLRRGMGEITHGQVRANLEARLASGEFQIVERSQGVPGRQFTTATTIEAEQEILRRMRGGRNHVEAVLSRPHAFAIADQHAHLNHAQKSVVEDVLSSPDRIQGIQGYAGAGKTTTLAVIRCAAESQAYQVEGFAPTSRAARRLNEAKVHAATLQSFLARGSNSDAYEQKHFDFVDESSLVSTNQIREFLERIGPNNNDRVLLIGDIRQHQGVEARRPFRATNRRRNAHGKAR
jgi:conjugative relaxase-like TrwC/TraI family protein